jgi:hypothetical protein
VKKLVIWVGAASVTAGMALTAAAVASAAPDVVGATYADAKQKITQGGQQPIIRTRVGDQVREDKCVVDNVQNAPGDTKTVYVSLNCNGGVASAASPGYSQQSPSAQTAKNAQEQAAAQQQGQSEQSVTRSNQH